MGYPDAPTYYNFLIRGIREAHGCGICSGNHQLSFHHLPDTKKRFTVGGASRAPWRIIEEIEKCTVLCSRCHATLHHLNPHFPRPVLTPLVLTVTEREAFAVRDPKVRITVMEATKGHVVAMKTS